MTESDTSLAGRVVELESLITHLQFELQQMSSVVVGQAEELARLRGLIDRMEVRIGELTDESAPRTLEDDKPPHY